MKATDRRSLDAQPRPPRYTGLHRGRYYYRGVLWLGPTNKIGAKPRTFVQLAEESHTWGLSCPA